MKDVRVELPYGKSRIEVRIPQKNLIGVYSPKDVRPVADVRKEVIRALAHPIGSGTLRDLARGTRKAVIVADDNTRLTPTDKILPVLLDEMNAAWDRKDQACFVAHTAHDADMVNFRQATTALDNAAQPF